MKKALFILILAFNFQGIYSQDYLSRMKDPNASLTETYNLFLEYVDGREISTVPGAKQFMRWYYHAQKNAFPHDSLGALNTAHLNYFQSFLSDTLRSNQLKIGGTWISYGPADAPLNGHNGKVDCIAIHPVNDDIMFIGGAMGLWRTDDAGANWSCLTDDFPLSGCNAVVIAESDPNVMYYAATGHYQYLETFLGVFKSVDGGVNWTLTGFNFSTIPGFYVNRMIVDPNNSNIVFIATPNGIFKTTDGGVTWMMMDPMNCVELVFKPGDANTIYAVGNEVKYSNDGGINWVTSPLPISLSEYYTIAVTPANSNYVYVCRTQFSGFGGCYRSTDSGVSFSLMSNTPNIYSSNANGTGTGGQGLYNLALTCDPTNPDKLFTGGVHLWTSDDGGATWYSNSNIQSTHADVQVLLFDNGYLYMGNDGGFFRSNDYGETWQYYQNMQTALIHRIYISEQNTQTLGSGWQDNGSNFVDNGDWNKVFGGDGFGGFIDFTNNNYRVASYQYGNFGFSTDGVNYVPKVFSNSSGVNSQGYFTTQISQNRTNPNELFIGKDKLYKSADKGITWQSVTNIPYTSLFTKINTFDICQINPSYIYVESVQEAFRSVDGGQSWNNITSGLPVSSVYIQKIVVDPIDSLHVLVVMAGVSDGDKVFESYDGGDNWSNISADLPNVVCRDIIIQKGSSDNRMYLSSAAGIFVRSNSAPSWQKFGTGLPNVLISHMNVDYENFRLYAATYGRGAWYADLIADSLSPTADYKYFKNSTCGQEDGNVYFIDISQKTPTAWQWYFPGGLPAVSNMPSPSVYYPVSGNYSAKLIVTNAWGIDSITYNFDVVNNPVVANLTANNSEGFENLSTVPSYFTVENPDNAVDWELVDSIGAYGVSSSSIMIDNFNNGNSGQQDNFVIETYDIADADLIELSFDIAYKPFNASLSDTLIVSVSNDCGETWQQKLVQHGNQLYVGTNYETNFFVPQSSDWKSYTINLNSYVGADKLSIRFENHSAGGNAMYIDNINLFANSNNPPVAAMSSNTIEICEGDSILFSDISDNFPTSSQWNFYGGDPFISTQDNEWVVYDNPGIFDVQLISSNLNGSDTLTEMAYVTVHPKPMIPSLIFSNDTLYAPGATNYNWYWDNYLLTGANDSILSVNQAGYYQVEVFNQYGCWALSDPYLVLLLDNAALNTLQFAIYPNPSDGNFTVAFNYPTDILWIEIYNQLGQKVFEKSNNTNSENNLEINADFLEHGTYILVLKNESNEILMRKKLVITE